MSALCHYAKDLNGLEEEDRIFNFLSRFIVENCHDYRLTFVGLLSREIYDCHVAFGI